MADINVLSDTSTDLVRVTQKANPWRNQAEVLSKYHIYPVIGRIFKGSGMKTVDGGTAIQWQTVLDDTGNARFVTPHEEVDYNATDVVGEFEAKWCLTHGYYMITEDEIEQNKASATRMQNLLKIKRDECMAGLWNKLELQAWMVPTGDAATQAKTPFGIPYSIPPITSAQVAASSSGFIGQNAVGFSACYGVDSTAAKYARYRSWADVMDNATADVTETTVDRILRMQRNIRWSGPMNAAEFNSGDYANLAQYTTDTMMTSLERKARANNDSLGADLGKFAGQVVTKGVPYVWSEALQEVSNATNPIVAVDHSTLQCIIHAGENFREYPPKRLQKQPRVIVTDVYIKYQLVNRNRRRCGRIDYVA